MNDLIREIENADSIAITGHINPDGDCIGSTLGMYNYITSNYPDKRVQVYLQEFPDVFMFLNGASTVKHEADDRPMICLCRLTAEIWIDSHHLSDIMRLRRELFA